MVDRDLGEENSNGVKEHGAEIPRDEFDFAVRTFKEFMKKTPKPMKKQLIEIF